MSAADVIAAVAAASLGFALGFVGGWLSHRSRGDRHGS